MPVEIQFSKAQSAHQQAIDSVFAQASNITLVTNKIVECIEAGGKVFWLGNGGSAADAQHMAAELMVRYVNNRRPLPSIALTTDTSILTAHTNDFEFETVFSRQLQGLARPGDVVIAMSTSGNSANVVKAVQIANDLGCYTVSMTGREESELFGISSICFQINTLETARAQEAHSLISHLICEGLDSVYA